MFGVKRPAYLVAPAYLLGLLLFLFCLWYPPANIGVPMGAILLLAMLTPLSLLHSEFGKAIPGTEGTLILHLGVWFFCLLAAVVFAAVCIRLIDWTIITSLPIWLQILMFVVVQQAMYFGIYAFKKPSSD